MTNRFGHVTLRDRLAAVRTELAAMLGDNPHVAVALACLADAERIVDVGSAKLRDLFRQWLKQLLTEAMERTKQQAGEVDHLLVFAYVARAAGFTESELGALYYSLDGGT